jgi:hypothetical protein
VQYLEVIRSATSITDSMCTASVKVSTKTLLLIIRYYINTSSFLLEAFVEILVGIFVNTSILQLSYESAAVGIQSED